MVFPKTDCNKLATSHCGTLMGGHGEIPSPPSGPEGLFTEFNGFGMSTPSAPGGASTIVAATKWRQHVAVDVSPQNRFALRIKPRSGDRKDRCRHFVAFEIWAVIFCGLTSTAIRCRHYRGWYAEHKARPQQSEAYRNHPTTAKLIPAVRPSQRCGTARFQPLNSANWPRRGG